MHVFLSVRTHTREKKKCRVGEKGIEAARQWQGDRGMTQQRLMETRNCVSSQILSLPSAGLYLPFDWGSLRQGRVSPQTGAP